MLKDWKLIEEKIILLDIAEDCSLISNAFKDVNSHYFSFTFILFYQSSHYIEERTFSTSVAAQQTEYLIPLYFNVYVD
jgi:hypothetical protein